MKAGVILRDAGMARAAANAERRVPQWSERAGNALRAYLQIRDAPFMTEEFRLWAEAKGLPQPPHLRAYGSVMLVAARRGLIRKIGHGQVSNPRAHCANAALWVRA